MAKLCRDQLAGKLVALFRESDPANIDGAVEQARRTFADEVKRVSCDELGRLFDLQIATLRQRGCPDQIVEILQNKKSEALPKMMEVWVKYNFKPLDELAANGIYIATPVIPRTYRSPYDLMTAVRNGDKAGYIYLNPNAITDVVDAPSDPYYCYNVEDGRSTLNKSPEQVEKIFRQQKRLASTAAETIAIAAHTSVLSHHYLWAVGSRFGSADGVPIVYLIVDDRPRLGWRYANSSDGHWGSPSCGSR